VHGQCHRNPLYALARVAVQRARELASSPTALLFLIHRSAWKANSANFRFTEF
jgi:hypothetical protein